MNRQSSGGLPQGGARTQGGQDVDDTDARVELRDAPAGRVGLALAGLAIALLLVCAAVAGLLSLLARKDGAPASPTGAVSVPLEPRLQIDEHVQRRMLETRATANLRSRPGHVGIDEAMRQIAEQGWSDGGRGR